MRWRCGASFSDRQTGAELGRRAGTGATGDAYDKKQKNDVDWIKDGAMLVEGGTAPVGRPRKTWRDSVYRLESDAY